eukprot:6492551-Amphidinium_carterae.1
MAFALNLRQMRHYCQLILLRSQTQSCPQEWSLAKTACEQLNTDLPEGVMDKANSVAARASATIAEATLIAITKKGKDKNTKAMLEAAWSKVQQASRQYGKQ